jgi:hypothetical protein
VNASRVWPSPDAYQNAVLSPGRFLRDARLHSAQVESRYFLGSQRPNLRSGNVGAVYRFKGPQGSDALKVYYKADALRQKRYQLIDQHLAGHTPSSHLVSFRYDEEGIQIHGRWYPTLVMDWAPGKRLDLYLQECRGEIRNGVFCHAFARMVRELQDRRMAHGDLQHGNILVQAAGQLKLVDYDGVFVPAMARLGLQAAESGRAAYQHPWRARRADYFDARLDDFAALVLLLTLASMTPERWRRYHADDNYLLVSKQSLHFPKRSALLHELSSSANAPLRRLANLLKIAASGSIEAIPPFAEVAQDPAIREIFQPSWKPGEPSTCGLPKVLRGGPWWQKPGERKLPVPPPARSILPLKGQPAPAILPLVRQPSERQSTNHAPPAQPARKPPGPAKNLVSQGSRIADLRLSSRLSGASAPRTSDRWRRWLLFWLILGLLASFAVAIDWTRSPAEQSLRQKTPRTGPTRGERNQP